MTKWISESKGGPFIIADSKRFKKDHEKKERPNPNWVAHPAITYESSWIKELQKANPELFKKLPYWDDAPVSPLKYDYSRAEHDPENFWSVSPETIERIAIIAVAGKLTRSLVEFGFG